MSQFLFLDVGSLKLSFGYVDTKLQFHQPSSVGHKIITSSIVGYNNNQTLVGDETYTVYASPVSISSIVHGQHVLDLTDYRRAVEHVFYNEMRCDPLETKLLFAHHPLLSNENKSKIAKFLFEDFFFQSYIPMNSLWLQLLGFGCTTGYIINFGHFETHMAYVSNGAMSGYQSIPIGGNTMIKMMIIRAAETGVKLIPKTINDVKVPLLKNCYFASDYNKEREELKKNPKKTYISFDSDVNTMHNGFCVDVELVDCPEIYFQPCKVAGVECKNVVDMILDCVRERNDVNSFDHLTLFLSGGVTKIPGLTERLSKELETHFRSRKIVKTNSDLLSDGFLGAINLMNLKEGPKEYTSRSPPKYE